MAKVNSRRSASSCARECAQSIASAIEYPAWAQGNHGNTSGTDSRTACQRLSASAASYARMVTFTAHAPPESAEHPGDQQRNGPSEGARTPAFRFVRASSIPFRQLHPLVRRCPQTLSALRYSVKPSSLLERL